MFRNFSQNFRLTERARVHGTGNFDVHSRRSHRHNGCMRVPRFGNKIPACTYGGLYLFLGR